MLCETFAIFNINKERLKNYSYAEKGLKLYPTKNQIIVLDDNKEELFTLLYEKAK